MSKDAVKETLAQIRQHIRWADTGKSQEIGWLVRALGDLLLIVETMEENQ